MPFRPMNSAPATGRREKKPSKFRSSLLSAPSQSAPSEAATVRERCLLSQPPMHLEQLLNHVPEYAKDLKLNLGSVTRQTELTEQQTWGTVVACAIAARIPRLLESLPPHAPPPLKQQPLSPPHPAAAL